MKRVHPSKADVTRPPPLSEEELGRAMALLGQDRWVQEQLRYEVQREKARVEARLEEVELSHNLEALDFVKFHHAPPAISTTGCSSLKKATFGGQVSPDGLKIRSPPPPPRDKNEDQEIGPILPEKLMAPDSGEAEAEFGMGTYGSTSPLTSPRSSQRNRTTREWREGIIPLPFEEPVTQEKQVRNKGAVAWGDVHSAAANIVGAQVAKEQAVIKAQVDKARLKALLEKQEAELGLAKVGVEEGKGSPPGYPRLAYTTGARVGRVMRRPDSIAKEAKKEAGRTVGKGKAITFGGPAGGSSDLVHDALALRQKERERRGDSRTSQGGKPSYTRQMGNLTIKTTRKPATKK